MDGGDGGPMIDCVFSMHKAQGFVPVKYLLCINQVPGVLAGPLSYASSVIVFGKLVLLSHFSEEATEAQRDRIII